jgi:hypothetical protein
MQGTLKYVTAITSTHLTDCLLALVTVARTFRLLTPTPMPHTHAPRPRPTPMPSILILISSPSPLFTRPCPTPSLPRPCPHLRPPLRPRSLPVR